MFFKWKQWQEDAALDSQIEKLLLQRKDKFITVLCLKWQVDRQYLLLAEARAALNGALIEHHQVDGELAQIDGRYSIVEAAEAEFKTDTQVKRMLKKLSKEERSKLIDELLEIGG